MSWPAWLLGIVVVSFGVLSAWAILGFLSLRIRKDSRAFLFLLALVISIAGAFIIAHWFLPPLGSMH
jgi:hypothetical protein